MLPYREFQTKSTCGGISVQGDERGLFSSNTPAISRWPPPANSPWREPHMKLRDQLSRDLWQLPLPPGTPRIECPGSNFPPPDLWQLLLPISPKGSLNMFRWKITRIAFDVLGLVLLAYQILADPAVVFAQQRQRPLQKGILPPRISTDKTIKYDYPIVYVRAARDPSHHNEVTVGFSNVDHHGTPPGAELMLLHPDGREEVLVPVKPDEGVTDPFVSFDGNWVYYAKHHQVRYGGRDALRKLQVSKGSDIFKIHVPTRKIVQLTHQEWTPNTGAIDPSLKERDVYNLGPCPVPGGKVAFVSDRTGFRAALHH